MKIQNFLTRPSNTYAGATRMPPPHTWQEPTAPTSSWGHLPPASWPRTKARWKTSKNGWRNCSPYNPPKAYNLTISSGNIAVMDGNFTSPATAKNSLTPPSLIWNSARIPVSKAPDWNYCNASSPTAYNGYSTTSSMTPTMQDALSAATNTPLP